nr:MAG TPA: hypothetical protein [Caudoviricetes sp.]
MSSSTVSPKQSVKPLYEYSTFPQQSAADDLLTQPKHARQLPFPPIS